MKMKCVFSVLLAVLISANSFAGLVGHWDFNGAAGSTTVEDLAGDNDAVIMGGATLNGSGQVEVAGGDSGQYVDLGAGVGQLVHNMTSFSIITDFVWDGNANGTWQKIWNFSQDGTAEYSILTLVSTNEEYIRFQHRYDAHDDKSSSSTPNLLGSHQVAIVYDATIGTYGAVRTYVDGVQEGYHTCDCDNSLAISAATPNNWLGRSPYDGGISFDGAYDEFWIYDEALGADAVAAHVPEPASMLLIGLGGLFLRKRK